MKKFISDEQFIILIKKKTHFKVDRQRKMPKIFKAGTRISSLDELISLNTTAVPFLRSKAGTMVAGWSAKS